MIDRNEITAILDEYETENVKIGLVGSHSALDVCDGAIEEGFRTYTSHRHNLSFFKSLKP